MPRKILEKLEQKEEISIDETVRLLEMDLDSDAYYKLLYLANRRARTTFGNRGYIFAQIGINAEPCPVNCRFCSMGTGHYVLSGRWRKTDDEILDGVRSLVAERIDDLFLMTTADYPVEKFLAIGRAVREILPDQTRLVANIGDFNPETARSLKEVGFTGAYHVVRLREGIDTTLPPDQRVATLDAIQAAGLELYYCVEPIGREHRAEEIAREIFRAKEYQIKAMAVMRRTPVHGTPLENAETISLRELCKIAAVTGLVVRPSRSMNVHEVTETSLLAGVNQLYAEAGANPRDTVDNTEKDRGFSVAKVRKILADGGFSRFED